MKPVKLTSPVNLAAMKAAAGTWGYSAIEALDALAENVGEDGTIAVHRDLLEDIAASVDDAIDEAKEEGAEGERLGASAERASIERFLSSLGLGMDDASTDIISKWRESHERRDMLEDALEMLGLESTMPLVVLRGRFRDAIKQLQGAAR